MYEFGERLAGLSMAQVAESLNIAQRLEDKPVLKGLLESGEVSVNKIVRVMSIATVANESELAEKIQLLSKNALEVFVRDVKLSQESALESLPGQTLAEETFSFLQEDVNELGLKGEVIQRLGDLKAKGIDVNEALLEFLNQREQELAETKDQIATQLPKSSSRYIPTRVKNIIKQEHGNQCAATRCQKPSENIHHTRRFGNIPSHDPNFMAPLCREHHQIAHAIDIKVAEMRIRK